MFKNSLQIAVEFHFIIQLRFTYCFDNRSLAPGFILFLPFVNFSMNLFKPIKLDGLEKWLGKKD